MGALHRLALRLGSALLRVLWFVTRPTLRGAAVLVRHEGRLLVVRTSYRSWIALPGGHVGRGETPAEAAGRELAEETGIRTRPNELHFVGDLVCRHSFVKDHVHFYELRPETRPFVRVDEREVIWADFMTEEEILARNLWPPLRQLLLHGPNRDEPAL